MLSTVMRMSPLMLAASSLSTALLVASVLPGLAADSGTPERRPNIVLIISEDNGPQLGCYGDPYVQTPNLDKLASQGVRFDRAYITQAGCSQSRSSILTGLYPYYFFGKEPPVQRDTSPATEKPAKKKRKKQKTE